MSNSHYNTNDFQLAQEPRPYSEAWFNALAAEDPLYAVVAANILETTQRTEACCVGGDIHPGAPTRDYKWSGRGATLRLCSSCKTMLGEYAPGETLVRVRGGDL